MDDTPRADDHGKADDVGGVPAREAWRDRTGEFSPGYYAALGSDDTSEFLAEWLGDRLDPDAPVLEVGCSAGRHLDCLREAGLRNLHGIDLNRETVDAMAERYPALADLADVRIGPAGDLVEGDPTDRFGAVYAVETLQHVPPEREWVFEELVRVTGDVLITAEQEDDRTSTTVESTSGDVPLYFRDWKSVFEDLGCTQVTVAERGRETIRAFRTPGEDRGSGEPR